MERRYRFLLPVEDADGTTKPPPLRSTRLPPECYWDFAEHELERIPELRRWFTAERLQPSEEGFVRATGELDPEDDLVLLGGSALTTAPVRGRIVAQQTCEVCRLKTSQIAPEPDLMVQGAPPADAALSYTPAIDAFLAPMHVVEELEAEGLASGLATAPTRTSKGDYVILYSNVGVGDPAAPYGTTGQTCPHCSRTFRRTTSGQPYPALPRYSFFLIFPRPDGDPQWVWSTIDGQTRMMVTPDVARWLQNRDPAVNVLTRGWSPDDLERAFLPEEYR